MKRVLAFLVLVSGGCIDPYVLHQEELAREAHAKIEADAAQARATERIADDPSQPCEARAKARIAMADRFAAEVAKDRIDPDRARSPVAAVGAAFGGLSGKSGADNPALVRHQRRVEQDLDAQKFDLEGRRTQLAAMYARAQLQLQLCAQAIPVARAAVTPGAQPHEARAESVGVPPTAQTTGRPQWTLSVVDQVGSHDVAVTPAGGVVPSTGVNHCQQESIRQFRDARNHLQEEVRVTCSLTVEKVTLVQSCLAEGPDRSFGSMRVDGALPFTISLACANPSGTATP